MVTIIEMVTESNVSWKDAVNKAVNEATMHYGKVSGIEILNWTADVKNGRIVDYKVNVNVAIVDTAHDDI